MVKKKSSNKKKKWSQNTKNLSGGKKKQKKNIKLYYSFKYKKGGWGNSYFKFILL